MTFIRSMGLHRLRRAYQKSDARKYAEFRLRNQFWKTFGNPPLLYLSHRMSNWGDALNAYLVDYFTAPRRSLQLDIIQDWPWVPDSLPAPVYLLVGSTLQFADSRCVVWGTGLISPETIPKEPPAEIRAVRGPLTRHVLQSHGMQCPERYGDPALLMGRFYKPIERRLKFRLGIIPHYVDAQDVLLQGLAADPEVTILDIMSPTESLIDRVCECDAVASSSLHGLIVAQAYGVPSVWIRVSDRLEGGCFKFHDYYASLGRQHVKPINIEPSTTASQLHGRATLFDLPFDLDDLDRSCPMREI